MPTPRPSQIWFDATTIFQLRKRAPVGLTRVEANVLKSALKLDRQAVRFCVFDRYSKSIREASRDSIEQILASFGATEPSSPGHRTKQHSFIRSLGRKLETQIRVSLRGAASKSKTLLKWQSGVPDWQSGDLFFVSGGTWDALSDEMLYRIVDQGMKPAVVLCDMIPVLFPHHFQSDQAVRSFTRFAEFVAKHSFLTLSISEATRRDFENFAATRGIAPQNSQVIRLGVESIDNTVAPSNGLPKSLQENEFVLFVSSIQVRKNHQLLYNVWRRFAEKGIHDIPKLVFAGGEGWLTSDLMYQIERDPLIQNSICVLNRVNDRQLHELYARSLFTLYPSLYEGWGLPIVESFQHGKPCIASNTSSMTEAGQGLAVHLDPYDFPSWYSAILKWHRDRNALAEAKKRIETSYNPYSWDDFGNDVCSRIVALL